MRAPCIPRPGPNPVSFDVIAPIPSRTPYRWNRDPIIRRMFLVPLIRGGMGCLLDDKSSSERQVPGDSRLVGDTSLRHFRGQTWNLSEPDLVVQTPKEQALDCQVEVFVVEASPLTVSLDKSSTNARIVAMEERL